MQFPLQSPKEYKESLSILEKHCRQIGRNFDEVERHLRIIYKSCKPSPSETFEKWSRKLVEDNIIGTPKNALKNCGSTKNFVSLVIMWFGDAPNLGGVELFAIEVDPVSNRLP